MSTIVPTTLGSGPKVSRVHSSAICLLSRFGIPGEATEAVEIGHREVVAEPIGVAADVRDADEPAVGPLEREAGDEVLHRRDVAVALGLGVGLHVEVEHFFPHRHEEAEVPLLAEVFLRDLQLDRLVGFRESAEQRRGGLADLEVDRAVLDLDDDVVEELAVERVEVVVGGLGAVVLGILPIHFVVVDEAAIEQDAAVRLEGLGDDVGGVGVGAAVFGRAEPAFGVGLEHEAAEVGDRLCRSRRPCVSRTRRRPGRAGRRC